MKSITVGLVLCLIAPSAPANGLPGTPAPSSMRLSLFLQEAFANTSVGTVLPIAPAPKIYVSCITPSHRGALRDQIKANIVRIFDEDKSLTSIPTHSQLAAALGVTRPAITYHMSVVLAELKTDGKHLANQRLQSAIRGEVNRVRAGDQRRKVIAYIVRLFQDSTNRKRLPSLSEISRMTKIPHNTISRSMSFILDELETQANALGLINLKEAIGVLQNIKLITGQFRAKVAKSKLGVVPQPIAANSGMILLRLRKNYSLEVAFYSFVPTGTSYVQGAMLEPSDLRNHLGSLHLLSVSASNEAQLAALLVDEFESYQVQLKFMTARAGVGLVVLDDTMARAYPTLSDSVNHVLRDRGCPYAIPVASASRSQSSWLQNWIENYRRIQAYFSEGSREPLLDSFEVPVTQTREIVLHGPDETRVPVPSDFKGEWVRLTFTRANGWLGLKMSDPTDSDLTVTLFWQASTRQFVVLTPELKAVMEEQDAPSIGTGSRDVSLDQPRTLGFKGSLADFVPDSSDPDPLQILLHSAKEDADPIDVARFGGKTLLDFLWGDQAESFLRSFSYSHAAGLIALPAVERELEIVYQKLIENNGRPMTTEKLLGELEHARQGGNIIRTVEVLRRGLQWKEMHGRPIRLVGDRWTVNGLARKGYVFSMDVRGWDNDLREQWLALKDESTPRVVVQRIRLIQEMLNRKCGLRWDAIAAHAKIKKRPLLGNLSRWFRSRNISDGSLEEMASIFGIEPAWLRYGCSRQERLLRMLSSFPRLSRRERFRELRRISGLSLQSLGACFSRGSNVATILKRFEDGHPRYTTLRHASTWNKVAGFLGVSPLLLLTGYQDPDDAVRSLASDALKVETIRLYKGLNQSVFGRYFGVSGPTVSNWEAGHLLPNDATRAKMCALVGAKPSSFGSAPIDNLAPAGLYDTILNSQQPLSKRELAVHTGDVSDAVRPLQILLDAGLISETRQGAKRIYHAVPIQGPLSESIKSILRPLYRRPSPAERIASVSYIRYLLGAESAGDMPRDPPRFRRDVSVPRRYIREAA